MTGYRISPDGHRLVFLADKGGERGGGRQVNIVNYRDRFAQVNQVQRQMPDDPLPVVESSIYLYELDGLESEDGRAQEGLLAHPHRTPRRDAGAGVVARLLPRGVCRL